uniref:Uncharacterized protein n=1 Tax=Panagrolaimus davidi TaxID=227884 RepID=A0A914QMT3_9BILA
MSREDQKRRDTFKMAYFTEIGAISRPIDISEFHDLAICAGIDIDHEAIQEAWPLDKEEIEMDEAYHLFTRLPNIELRVKYQLENHKKITGTEELPFDSLISYAQVSHRFYEKLDLRVFIQIFRIH